jgi:hypothetical protein
MEDVANIADIQAAQKLIDKAVREPQEIPLELYSGLGKAQRIINNSDETVVLRLKDDCLDIQLSAPIFITRLYLTVSKLTSVKGMRITFRDELTSKNEKATFIADSLRSAVYFDVKKVVTSLRLEKNSLFSKDISKVQLFGLFSNELEQFEKDYTDLKDFKKAALQEIEEKMKALSAENVELATLRQLTSEQRIAADSHIEGLNQESSTLYEQIEEFGARLAELKTKVSENQAKQSALEAKNDALEKQKFHLESELSQKTETLHSVNLSISQSEVKLDGLVNNVNVFSEEFSTFVEQGARQSSIYTLLSLIPLILLTFVIANLFHGAVDLSTKFEELPKISLLTLLVSRMPYVVIAAFIVGITGKSFFYLIGRVISINQQRLDLATIAIIAKDVSDASSVGINLSRKEKYEAKTYLKMSVLKSYLSGHIQKFSYVPNKEDSSDDLLKRSLSDVQGDVDSSSVGAHDKPKESPES